MIFKQGSEYQKLHDKSLQKDCLEFLTRFIHIGYPLILVS